MGIRDWVQDTSRSFLNLLCAPMRLYVAKQLGVRRKVGTERRKARNAGSRERKITRTDTKATHSKLPRCTDSLPRSLPSVTDWACHSSFGSTFYAPRQYEPDMRTRIYRPARCPETSPRLSEVSPKSIGRVSFILPEHSPRRVAGFDGETLFCLLRHYSMFHKPLLSGVSRFFGHPRPLPSVKPRKARKRPIRATRKWLEKETFGISKPKPFPSAMRPI